MAVTVLLATALLANAATLSVADTPTREWSDVTHQEVAFEELTAGQPEAAIAKIEANGGVASRDPAALINLGNAHARLGRTEKALEYYSAAIASDVRYDLELADGRWLDSRQAARMARDSLLKRGAQALRQ
ncbi:MAG: tetratricopeptide repeat protein [Burkholderiales bacterium]|nr:MAG: tetratricopeptide repeat protein [Burkholderiales bacterium]